jgi:hypothetical protein
LEHRHLQLGLLQQKQRQRRFLLQSKSLLRPQWL